MANRPADPQHQSLGAWAKRYFFATRAVMETALRPHDLGSSQWYVLYHLVHDGPTAQRDLVRILRVERATLSGVVATLVRKGLVQQHPDPNDQRQRVLQITDQGRALWDELPDPIALIQEVALEGADTEELATAIRVLEAATDRLHTHISQGHA